MSEEKFALSTLAAPSSPAPPGCETDYEMILAAMMETARGRWFVAEHARRQRNADIKQVLAAIDRIETMICADRARLPLDVDDTRKDLAAAIAHAKAEIGAITPEVQHDGNIWEPAGTVNSLVQTSERAVTGILAATERVQDIAWTFREKGITGEICDQLDSRSRDINIACYFLDLNNQRIRRFVTLLDELDKRITAMRSAGNHGASAPQPDAERSHCLDGDDRGREDVKPARSAQEAAPIATRAEPPLNGNTHAGGHIVIEHSATEDPARADSLDGPEFDSSVAVLRSEPEAPLASRRSDSSAGASSTGESVAEVAPAAAIPRSVDGGTQPHAKPPGLERSPPAVTWDTATDSSRGERGAPAAGQVPPASRIDLASASVADVRPRPGKLRSEQLMAAILSMIRSDKDRPLASVAASSQVPQPIAAVSTKPTVSVDFGIEAAQRTTDSDFVPAPQVNLPRRDPEERLVIKAANDDGSPKPIAAEASAEPALEAAKSTVTPDDVAPPNHGAELAVSDAAVPEVAKSRRIGAMEEAPAAAPAVPRTLAPAAQVETPVSNAQIKPMARPSALAVPNNPLAALAALSEEETIAIFS